MQLVKSKIFFAIVGFFVLIFIVSVAVVVLKRPMPKGYEVRNEPLTQKQNEKKLSEDFLKIADKIYKNTKPDKQLLFYNAKDIELMRLGPDGNTIHFKILEKARGAKCAYLATVVGKIEPGIPDPPPRVAPWDYNKIANYGTIEGCGESGQSGGYANDGSFSYFKKDFSGKVSLVIERPQNGEILTLAISDSDWSKSTYEYQTDTNSFKDKNGNLFYYPKDRIIIGEKGLFAIGRFVIAVDLAKKKNIGTVLLIKPTYDIIGDAYWFSFDINSPLVVLESGWEGWNMLNAVMDLSQEKFRVISLSGYRQPNNVYKTHLASWDNTNLSLHFYKEVNVTNLISEAQQKEFFANLTEEQYKTKTHAAEKQIMLTGKYVDARCALGYGMGESKCTALTQGDEFRMKPGGQLEKIK